MSLKVTNTADNSIVHQNNYRAGDFNTAQLVEAAKEMHLPFGDAYMAHWYFEGIRMAYSRWKYKSSQTIEWTSELDVVTIYFSIKGKVTLNAPEFGRQFTFTSGQHNMFYSGHFKGTFTNYELEQETFILQFTRDVFIRLAAGCSQGLELFTETVKEGKPVILSAQNLHMDVAMHHAINQVLNCAYTGGLKKLFLHAKSLELFAAHIAVPERNTHKTQVYCKTDYDRERIIFARDYILQHLDLPPSLTQLARIAGINEFKLKHGFKELFNTTVFGYLAEQRLELAKHDILAGKKTATEIAFELGYASPQHFSAAFKKKFGVSPKRVK